MRAPCFHVKCGIIVCFAVLVLPCARTPCQESVDDDEITKAVRTVLRADFRLDAEAINVTSSNGWVTLVGHVSSYPSIRQAEQLTGRVRGVRGVTNQIEVAPTSRPDDQIAADVRERLHRDTYLKSDGLRTEVHNGVVTLSGTVDSWAQASEAETVIGSVRGVLGVRNNLACRPGEGRADGELRQAVKDELRRDAVLADVPIDVNVVGGVVTLLGDVSSLYHRDLAEQKTRLVGSVKQINNLLKVRQRGPVTENTRSPNDAAVERFVRRELNQDPRIGADGISLKITSGHLILSGQVSSLFEKDMAERVARSVIGVSRVDNQLVVAVVKRADKDIRDDITLVLSTDAILHEQPIRITMNDGSVTLGGEVRDFTSKKRAASLAGRVPGVFKVVNETKVAASAHLGDGVITSLVTSRLHANVIVRPVADRIQVQTSQGVVALHGSVQTWAQQAAADRAAFFTDGVRAVDNQLKVGGS